MISPFSESPGILTCAAGAPFESRKVKVLPSKSFSPRSSSSDFGASVSDAVFCSEPPDAVVSLPPFEDVSPQDTLRSNIMSANDSDKVLFIFSLLSFSFRPEKTGYFLL